MADSEKWAWWALGVVILVVVADIIFVAFLGHGPAILSVFSLLALTAIPRTSRRYFTRETLDEREREIASKAIRAAFSGCWVVFTGLILTIAFIKGWDTTITIPTWTLEEALLWATVFILGVQAVTTIVLCRGGFHA